MMYQTMAKENHEPMKARKKIKWTYLHLMSSMVLKKSDRNRRRLFDTLVFPMLTCPLFDTIRFLNFSECGSMFRKCFPFSSLFTKSPKPNFGVSEPAEESFCVRPPSLDVSSDGFCTISDWLSTALLTLMCLIPPLPSSIVTSVGP